MFLFGADYFAELLPDKNKGSWLVWDKRKESQADAIGSEFELIWSRNKHKRRMLRHDWFGFSSSENGADARNRVHPTQKPITLLADILNQWGKDANVIVDLYGGSGSTLIACEQLNRKCYMMELDPHYVDVIIERWENFKGRVQWVLDEIKKGTIESSLEAGTTEIKKTMPTTTGKDQWKKNDKGWWYEYADGSYPTNKWLKIDNEWYYFGNDGYAYCNKWVKWNDVWYWLDKDCKMVKDCILLINGKYYAFDKDGKMKTDVEVSDNGDLIL